MVETNMGRGAVYGIITNSDGSISKSLAELIRAGAPAADFEEELQELREYMFKEGIICGDFNRGNLLVQRQENGSKRLIIIDGLGNSDFIKLADYFRPHRDSKLKRKWDHLTRRLHLLEEQVRQNEQG
jgi:hypothetical protein